ncbi:hypothetical protein [Paraburkholderia silvatlantica]|uniref:hypothetical protein n=1 Tax=Paraburkholderia silvatlantica TaxID=321895 RepID=UPI0037530BE1
MSDARRPAAMSPLARAFSALFGLALLCSALLVIVGSVAGVVALLRWLLSLIAVCST